MCAGSVSRCTLACMAMSPPPKKAAKQRLIAPTPGPVLEVSAQLRQKIEEFSLIPCRRLL